MTQKFPITNGMYIPVIFEFLVEDIFCKPEKKEDFGGYFVQLGIGELFSNSALPDSEIPILQLETSCQTVDFISPIGGNFCLLKN